MKKKEVDKEDLIKWNASFGTFDSKLDDTIDALQALKIRFNEESKYLNKKADKLKSEKDTLYNKDEYISSLKSKCESLQKEKDKYEDLYNSSFQVSESEQKKINKWIIDHEVKKHGQKKGEYHYAGAAGGCYSYIFTPTGLGTIGSIKCSCGEEFTFTDMDNF